MGSHEKCNTLIDGVTQGKAANTKKRAKEAPERGEGEKRGIRFILKSLFLWGKGAPPIAKSGT